MTNYEIALKAERKRVVRCFQHYTTDQICNLAVGRASRVRLMNRGEFFYMHPDLPNVAFDTRGQAAEAALRAQA